MKKNFFKRQSGKKSLKVCLIFLLIGGIFFPNCGSRGPLTLVPAKKPLQVTSAKIYQIDKHIILKWKFPEILSDNTTALDPQFIKYVFIFHAGKIFNAKNFKKIAKLFFKLPLSEISKQKEFYTLNIAFKTKNLDDKDHYFGILYRYQREKSHISSILHIKTLLPARKIDNLTLSQENKVIILQWSKPILNIDNKPVTSISGYNIYRMVTTKDQKVNEFIKLNQSDKILKEYYEDRDTSGEGTYSYYVTTVHNINIESDKSNKVQKKIKNIYPPSVPQNLICIKDNKSINLIWKKVEDKDFAYYRIYRKRSSEEEFKILADKITRVSHIDTGLKKGETYCYRVSAVDTFGNESELSNTVKEIF